MCLSLLEIQVYSYISISIEIIIFQLIHPLMDATILFTWRKYTITELGAYFMGYTVYDDWHQWDTRV